MAVSFRIVIYLTALGVFGFAFVMMADTFVPAVDPIAAEQASTSASNTFLQRQREMWRLLPVFFGGIAASLWLLRETVQIRRP